MRSFITNIEKFFKLNTDVPNSNFDCDKRKLIIPLPELQDHRLCGRSEQEHREKTHRRTGCKAAHHYRTDRCHHQERTKA